MLALDGSKTVASLLDWLIVGSEVLCLSPVFYMLTGVHVATQDSVATEGSLVKDLAVTNLHEVHLIVDQLEHDVILDSWDYRVAKVVAAYLLLQLNLLVSEGYVVRKHSILDVAEDLVSHLVGPGSSDHSTDLAGQLMEPLALVKVVLLHILDLILSLVISALVSLGQSKVCHRPSANSCSLLESQGMGCGCGTGPITNTLEHSVTSGT